MPTYTSRETYDFISKQTNDPIVEWKTCKVSGQPFPIYQSDVDFYDKISPTFNGKKYQIPTPTLCPEERQRRRPIFRNERKLYKGKSALSGKPLISLYSSDKPFKVYTQEERRSDQRDAMDYGRDYDFSQPFTENFRKLILEVPRVCLNNQYTTLENAKYNNNAQYLKDCYFTFGCNEGERNLYLDISRENTDTVDSLIMMQTQNCYECIESIGCYECRYSFACIQCNHLYACTDLQGCSFCINCRNLRNQSYCIHNQKVSPETFQTYLKDHLNEVQHYNLADYKMNMFLNNCEHCFGNALHNSHHSIFCFDSLTADSKYTSSTGASNQSVDADHCGAGTNIVYEGVNNDEGYQMLFSANTVSSKYLLYCDACMNCQDCFACGGLRDKKYCILNKQYEKAEYERHVAQIIEQMQQTGERGEFFHPSLSPFGYNETVANEYLPLEKADLPTQHGYKRSDYSSDPKIPENAELLHPATLPDDQRKILVNDESILRKIIICAESGRPFTIQKLELDFYRKMGLPLPKLHPDIRHKARMKQRPGRTLHLRTCDKCGKEIVSVFSANDKRTILCEACYQKEVYR